MGRVLSVCVEELRQAARRLRRSPGLVATVVATLGLAIGAHVAMFDTVDRLMFRPLAHLRDPGTVHRFYLQWRSREATVTGMSGPYPRLLDFQKWTTSFSALAGFSERDLAVGEGEEARDRRVSAVSASYFGFFDARPALGRFFTTDEDVTPTGAEVAVLSYAFWQSEFGGRDVRGERLQVGNMRATIVGVAPRGFSGVGDALPPAVFVPITTFAASTGTNDAKTYFTKYQWGWMHIMGRRKPGVTLVAAEADATRAFEQSWIAAGPDNPDKAPVEQARPRVVLSSLRPGGGPVPSLEARTSLWLGGVALVVLVIACANVANLLLARALERRRETAVRLVLGVTRQRLILQSVSEGLVLAALSGATALLVAQAGGSWIRGLLMRTSGADPVIAMEPRTLLLTLVTILSVGVLVGLVPSLLVEGGDMSRTLRGGIRGGRTQGARLRSGLLVAQTALSMTLLVGAALFLRSLEAVKAMRMGYDVERVLLVSRIVRGPWPGPEAIRGMRDTLMATAQALPGVESAAWVSSVPFLSTSNTAVFLNGVDVTKEKGAITYQATTADYFRTMGTRVLRGRAFTAADGLGAPNVAVVGESMARALWPGQDAIGQCFQVFSETAPCATVVGVAEDMVQRDLAGAERYHYYLPLDQFTRTSGNYMLLKLRGDPATEAETIRRLLQRVMPAPSYVATLPLRGAVEDARRPWRLGATMFVMFGVLALVVAAVGLRGALGYNVSQRTSEFALRVAMGAQRRDILKLVLTHNASVSLLGVTLGVAAALAAGAPVQPLLFRQSATDPLVYGFVAAIMLLVAATAGLGPAVRASRTDPASALRSE
jgi:putative ABC transport system permease protein